MRSNFLSLSMLLMKPSKATFSKTYFMKHKPRYTLCQKEEEEKEERERQRKILENMKIHNKYYSIKNFTMTFSIENDLTYFTNLQMI